MIVAWHQAETGKDLGFFSVATKTFCLNHQAGIYEEARNDDETEIFQIIICHHVSYVFLKGKNIESTVLSV